MPVTLPPPEISQELPADDYRLQGAMTENERKLWRVAIRSAPREPEPCADPKGGEIVVCAPVYDDPARDRLGPAIPDAPTAMEELNRKLHLKIGPVDIHGASGTGIVGVTLSLKF